MLHQHLSRFFLMLCLLSLPAFSLFAQLPLIPWPAEVKDGNGTFQFKPQNTIFVSNPELKAMAGRAAAAWEQHANGRFSIADYVNNKVDGSIYLVLNTIAEPNLGTEGYQLSVETDRIKLTANTAAGISYGLQTLGQLMDMGNAGKIDAIDMVDFPRFPYRGMHLDVSRHFMPVELIYKLLDELEHHKMNVFHWHLVDDQGWRIEIKKYPKLTAVGAWREDKSNVHWNDRSLSKAGAKTTYGGFYTQEEISSVVAYAAERNITVIPEIEMPAHVMSALAAYPELSCTGENLGVPPGGVWPITHIYCAGKEETFHFLEDVLTEVMELFPSTFIHIGGDEADKTNWKKCNLCQKRIKDEGLKDEHELQSYFIHRIEKFLNARGRQLIGWDEILEGGLAPNAIVMSWRGEDGGIAAAKMGHQVIMTPGSHCYFDHYQGDPSVEPLAIGGYTPLSKVYAYEPIPAALTTEEARYVLGAQANHWTEYMPVSEQVEYMAFPRLAALSEVLWSPKEARNWDSFTQRLPQQMKRYALRGLNVAHSAWQVAFDAKPLADEKTMVVQLTTELPNTVIRYSIDGSSPANEDNAGALTYTEPIRLDQTTTLTASTFGADGQPIQTNRRNYLLHKAFSEEISLASSPNERYAENGAALLVNGITGTLSHNDHQWLGFDGKDMEATIDLKQSMEVSQIRVHCLSNLGAWIAEPRGASFEVSNDGVHFQKFENITMSKGSGSGRYLVELKGEHSTAIEARFVRVKVFNAGPLPEGHPGEGKGAWLFVSEVVVE